MNIWIAGTTVLALLLLGGPSHAQPLPTDARLGAGAASCAQWPTHALASDDERVMVATIVSWVQGYLLGTVDATVGAEAARFYAMPEQRDLIAGIIDACQADPSRTIRSVATQLAGRMRR